jgi:surfeit locus 1 family protein
MTSPTRALILPSLLTGLALAVLGSLGVWQLMRLDEKDRLVAQIETSLTAPAAPLPASADWPALKPQDYDYRRVSLSGTFQHDKEAFVFGFIDVGQRGDTSEGFFTLTPLVLADGSTVIVNRGFVPQAFRDQTTRKNGLPEGVVTLTGILRAPEKRGFFTPQDTPATNLFFAIDPAPIADARHLEKVAPFIVDADKTTPKGVWPEGGHTIVALVNNHLQYALTWFALAFVLAGVFFVFARDRLMKDTRPSALN